MSKGQEQKLFLSMFQYYTAQKDLTKIETLFEAYKDIDINAKDKDGKTLLHSVLETKNDGFLDVVEILIKKGANPNIKNNEGKTAFDLIDLENEDLLYNFQDAIEEKISRSSSVDSLTSNDSTETYVEPYVSPVENARPKPSFLAGISAKGKANTSTTTAEEIAKTETKKPISPLMATIGNRSLDVALKKKQTAVVAAADATPIEPLSLADYQKPLDQIRPKLSKFTAQYIIDNDDIVTAANNNNPDIAFLLIRKLADAKGVDPKRKKEVLASGKAALLANQAGIGSAIQEVKTAAEEQKAADLLKYENIEKMSASQLRASRKPEVIAILDKHIDLSDYLPSDRAEILQESQEELRKEAVKKLHPNLALEKEKTEERYQDEIRRAQSSKEALIKSIKQIDEVLTKKEVVKEETKASRKSISVISENPPPLSENTELAISAYHQAAKDKSAEKDKLQRKAILRIYGDFTNKLITLDKSLESSGLEISEKDKDKYIEESLIYHMNRALNHSNSPMVKNGIAAAVRTSDIVEIKSRVSNPENQEAVQTQGAEAATSALEALGIKRDAIKVRAKTEQPSIGIRPPFTPAVRSPSPPRGR